MNKITYIISNGKSSPQISGGTEKMTKNDNLKLLRNLKVAY